jgi:steroid delta-isomerase-like uncharacterized protein
MSNLERATAYFEAWNRHDADAIVAAFADSGTYSDPTTKAPLSGAAIGAYAQGLWAAFPDLSFEIGSTAETAADKIVAEWTMTGTQTGAFAGLPPTGRTVALPGIDVLRTGPEGIRSVTGYFDSRAVPEQLGLEAILQPRSIGPFSFGTSVAVSSGKTTRPGAFSITTIWNDGEQDEEIRALSQATANEMLQMEGFIGLTLMRIGGRGITISAWEEPEHPRQLFGRGAHREAMTRFWAELGDSAFTSVWTPERINPLWVRCTSCGKMTDHEKSGGRCACGQALPEAPAYY